MGHETDVMNPVHMTLMRDLIVYMPLLGEDDPWPSWTLVVRVLLHILTPITFPISLPMPPISFLLASKTRGAHVPGLLGNLFLCVS